jgi:hypothetical protein
MRKNIFALAIVAALAANIPSATASTSPSKAIASIQKVLNTKSAELKAWLAKELKEEGVLGGTYVPQINAANQKATDQIKEVTAKYAPLIASTDTTVSYPAQSNFFAEQALITTENQKVVADLKAAWAAELKGIDEVYEPAEDVMLEQIAVAKDALLSVKRASKDPSAFDSAFVTAMTFEFNRASLVKTAKADWTGKIKVASLNTLAKVKSASTKANQLAASYTNRAASAFNAQIGSTFTGGSAFKKHLASAKALLA